MKKLFQNFFLVSLDYLDPKSLNIKSFLITSVYQHFNTTESSKVVAQWTVCGPTSVPKKC